MESLVSCTTKKKVDFFFLPHFFFHIPLQSLNTKRNNVFYQGRLVDCPTFSNRFICIHVHVLFNATHSPLRGSRCGKKTKTSIYNTIWHFSQFYQTYTFDFPRQEFFNLWPIYSHKRFLDRIYSCKKYFIPESPLYTAL